MENKNEFCYLLIESGYNDLFGEYNNTYVYKTEEGVKKAFKESVQWLKTHNENDNLTEEEDDNSYSLYEEGNYVECHDNISWEKVCMKE